MKRGFTLIELMVAIAVIGVLAAIAFLRFANITRDAEVAQIQANRKNLETALHMFMVKEDKETKDLFGEDAKNFDKFEAFYKYFSKNELPHIPGTERNKPLYYDYEKYSPNEERLGEIAESSGFGWVFTSRGTVYPGVKENRYGIRFDEF